MEEKKVIKVSLGTVICIVIIVLLVIALGGMWYYYNYIKDRAQTSIQTDTQTNNTISLDNTQDATDKISDSKVDEIAKDLFEKGSHKIRETEYSDYYEYESVQPVIEKTINGETYQKRNVLYANVEKEYSKIFTGDALKNVLGKRFAEIDGDLYVSYGGATGWDVTNIKVSRISGNNNEIEYTVTYNDVDISDRITEEYSCKMTIKLVDGSYRISKINYCNIDKNS